MGGIDISPNGVDRGVNGKEEVETVTINDSFKISVKGSRDMGQWLERSREGFSFLKWQILKDGENSEEGEINDVRGNDSVPHYLLLGLL